ncbi:hypothetical protein GCM10027519_47350 [Kineococcus endophyticus]
MEHLRPRFNRRGHREPATWWVNEGGSFTDESRVGVVFAGLGGNAVAHHRDVGRRAVEDTVVHYCRGDVVALGEVVTDSVQARQPYGPVSERDYGWLTRVEYFELAVPLPLASLPERSPVEGPFDKSGAVKQGYLFRRSDAYVDALRDHIEWPAGSPWSGAERRYWLFQANPIHWDLAAHLPDMPPRYVEDWTAAQHRTQMGIGRRCGAVGLRAQWWTARRRTIEVSFREAPYARLPTRRSGSFGVPGRYPHRPAHHPAHHPQRREDHP